jgi:ComEC/Rec2-related protein
VAWILFLALVAGVTRHFTGAIILLALLAAHAAWRRRADAWLFAVAAACCALAGYSSAFRLERNEAAVRAVASRQGAALVELAGVVDGFPRTGRHGTAFDFATRVDGRAVRVEVRAAFFDVAYGDRLLLRARLSPPGPDDGLRLRARGLAGRARVRLRDTTRLGRDGGCPVARAVLWPLHRFARTRLLRPMGEDAALALGLLLGERGHIDDAAREAVRRLGIAHLLAISGMHLAPIAGCVLLLTRRAPRAALPAVLAAITLYTGMVGDVESLTRAYLMSVWVAAAHLLLRPVRLQDALGATLLVMALARPPGLHAIGLQLSFAATFALVVVMPSLPRAVAAPSSRWRRGGLALWRSVSAAFVVSAAVEVFIAPLQLYHFGSLSVAGPVATVIFFIPVTAILIAAAATVAVSVVPVAGAACAQVLAVASTRTMDLIEIAGRLAPAPVQLPVPSPWIYYAALALGWRLRRRWYGWAAAAAGVLVSFLA